MAKRAPQHEDRKGAGAEGPVDGVGLVREWFRNRGWTPFEFQEEAWGAYRAGGSGLIHVPTGAGKTLAAFGGPLAELAEQRQGKGEPRGLRVLYVTPLRAVARDIELALKEITAEVAPWARVESRTGDTKQSVRARQRKELPEVLVTTPESLCLLLTREDARERLGGVSCVIVDEWHELLSSKRGTQVELALARVRACAPGVRTWAMSATIENIEEAARSAVGEKETARIVTAKVERRVVIETVLPSEGEEVREGEARERLPWAGHLGMPLLPAVLRVLDPGISTIVFVNTRSQAERWFHAIAIERPEWESRMGLHHGSVDRGAREKIERGLKTGEVGIVVATSSLDLGVDFAPVERVMQIGSPKGIARLIQRAGRSGHTPGGVSRILCVPTHAMEVVEVEAVRRAMRGGAGGIGMEPRRSLEKPLDVLAQHIVTCAIGGGSGGGVGGGVEVDGLYEEVRSTAAYRELTRAEFDWALSLAVDGAGLLRAYPQYRKVVVEDGVARVATARAAQMHRLNVGTITGEATMDVRFATGRRLGSIEEDFISGLRAGDKFVFAGKVLELKGVHDNAAIVRPAKGSTTHTPLWAGTKLPISEALSEGVRTVLGEGEGDGETPEGRAIARLRAIQGAVSCVPRGDEALIEVCATREGSHAFIFPFEGRLVHGGLAALLAFRLTRASRTTLSTASNDYGFELLGPEGFDFEGAFDAMGPEGLFDASRLMEEAAESVNLGEMAKRQFREIARVAGLVFQAYPGSARSGRQTQVGASLLYDVFMEFDPTHPLLEQARREVLERQFEESRLARTLARLRASRLVVKRIERPSPLSLPLVIERVGARMSSETLTERIRRIEEQWEKDASRSTSRGRRSR
ncbi:MAG: ligase-associated DNA damage response DEXH box helicase [Phycisphaeraceae bacterium]|nr:MAG: ligase-associated DNA damage response DEXH box helicase [Phycisphaeraceae bacterium]